jgi:hypothetical protein
VTDRTCHEVQALIPELALGVAPGPQVGRVVRAVYERQLDGAVTSVDEARAEARRILDSGAVD